MCLINCACLYVWTMMRLPSSSFQSYFLWRIFDWKKDHLNLLMTLYAKYIWQMEPRSKLSRIAFSPLKVRFQFSLLPWAFPQNATRAFGIFYLGVALPTVSSIISRWELKGSKVSALPQCLMQDRDIISRKKLHLPAGEQKRVSFSQLKVSWLKWIWCIKLYAQRDDNLKMRFRGLWHCPIKFQNVTNWSSPFWKKGFIERCFSRDFFDAATFQGLDHCLACRLHHFSKHWLPTNHYYASRTFISIDDNSIFFLRLLWAEIENCKAI